MSSSKFILALALLLVTPTAFAACPAGGPTSCETLLNALTNADVNAALGATITLGSGKTFTVTNTLTFTGTDSTSFAFPSASGTVATLAATQTLTNKTINGATFSGTIAGTPTYSGIPIYSGLSSGTIVSGGFMGLDGGNHVVLGNGGGGGSGCTTSGSSGELLTDNGSGGCTSNTTGTGVVTALGVNVGSAGAPVVFNGALGTPSSGTATNLTGLPLSTGITGFGTGVASALSDNVGSAGAPVVYNGALGTPSSGTGTNITGIPGGNLVITDSTHTTSTNVANIGGQDNFNGSSLTATIPGTGTIGSGATILVTNQNATAPRVLTLTESQTVNGCPTAVLGYGGFLTGTGNGTSFDAACFPGYGTITSNALPKFSSTITGGFTASAISDNGTTVTSTEPVALTASGATVAMTGTSTGTTTIATANASGTSYTQTLPARTASIVNGPSSSTTGDCVEFNGASGTLLQDAGSACGSGGGGGGGTLNYSDNGVTVTAGTYYAPPGGGGAPQSTEASVDIAAPAAATISNLQVGISTTLGGSSTGFTVTLRDAGAGTALTCTFNPSSATSCGDTTHSVNIAKGDLIDWQIVTAGTIVGTPVITIAAANGTSGVGVTAVTGTSPIVSSGGTTPAVSCATCVTAASSLTAHGVVVGAGSQATAVTAVGTSGQVLTSNGAGSDPTFQAAGGGSYTGTWTTYSPTYTCTSGSISGMTTTTARYNTNGKVTLIYLNFTFPSSTAGCTVGFSVSLPNTATNSVLLTADETAVVGNSGVCRNQSAGGTSCNLVQYNNNPGIGNSYQWLVSGVYENQ